MDIKKRLETLDTAKAPGPDNILAILLKTYAPKHAAPLAKLFQYSYNTDVYPTMCKVMEDVTNNAIKQHLLSNSLLSDAQFGFSQGHSAPNFITALVQTWTKDLNSRHEAPEAEYEMLLQQFAGGIIVTLKEAQDGHVIQGMGGGVKMVGDQKVLSFVANRAQLLYKVVSEPLLGLTDVEKATSGAEDAVGHIDGCAGEPLSNVEGLFCAL
eukprot:g31741.t1